MQLSTSKTKEMILGPPIAKTDLPLLTTPIGTIERVWSFKLLLGVHIESSLSWSTHVNNMLKKPSPADCIS